MELRISVLRPCCPRPIQRGCAGRVHAGVDRAGVDSVGVGSIPVFSSMVATRSASLSMLVFTVRNCSTIELFKLVSASSTLAFDSASVVDIVLIKLHWQLQSGEANGISSTSELGKRLKRSRTLI